MSKIESMSPEQWAEVPKIRQWWLDNASRQVPKADSDEAIKLLYGLKGLPAPQIINVASPLGACVLIAAFKNSDKPLLKASLGASLRASLGASLGASFNFYSWQYDCGYFDGGALAGVLLDAQKYSVFKKITSNLSVIFPYQNFCIVCDSPVYCGWDDAGRIHGENRAAVEYSDGFKVWAIEGIRVPESVVMDPHLQTIEEINNEQNEEIKRIRINRFGWSRFISESGGKELDTQIIRTPSGFSWMESLMQCVSKDAKGDAHSFTVLCTSDPSTGRLYALEVNPSCTTCRQAQRYLLAPAIAFGRHGVDVDKIETYPMIRA